jgi:hypothetical protein
VENPSLGGLLSFKTNIFEVAGIPQRVEVTLDRSLIVDISGVGEDSCFDRFSRNAAITVNSYVGNYILLSHRPGAE